MSLALLLAAGLATCAPAGPADLGDLPGKDTPVVLHLQGTSLDRVFEALGAKAGFETTFRGFTPTVDALYEERPLRDVLEDLASRFGLVYRVAGPSALEVSAPLLSGTGGVTVPRVKHRVQPSFPPEAAGTRGKVVLSVIVCEDGLVGSVSVLRGPETPSLRRAALDAVRQWTFEPATRDGAPVSTYFSVVVEFVE